MQNSMGIPIPYICFCESIGSSTGLGHCDETARCHVLQIKTSTGGVLVKDVDYSYTSTGITYLTDCSTKQLKFTCTKR